MNHNESGLSNLSMLTRVVYDYEVERDGLVTVKIGRRTDYTQPVTWSRHEGLGEDDAIDKAAAAMLCNGVKPTVAVKTATEHLRVITDHHNENNLFCDGCGLAVEVLADVEEWLCPDCCSDGQTDTGVLNEIRLWTLRDVKGAYWTLTVTRNGAGIFLKKPSCLSAPVTLDSTIPFLNTATIPQRVRWRNSKPSGERNPWGCRSRDQGDGFKRGTCHGKRGTTITPTTCPSPAGGQWGVAMTVHNSEEEPMNTQTVQDLLRKREDRTRGEEQIKSLRRLAQMCATHASI